MGIPFQNTTDAATKLNSWKTCFKAWDGMGTSKDLKSKPDEQTISLQRFLGVRHCELHKSDSSKGTTHSSRDTKTNAKAHPNSYTQADADRDTEICLCICSYLRPKRLRWNAGITSEGFFILTSRTIAITIIHIPRWDGTSRAWTFKNAKGRLKSSIQEMLGLTSA